MWRFLLTLTLVFAALVAAASMLIYVDFSLLPVSSGYPWGRAIGEITGSMMVPAIIMWLVSGFRRWTLFAVVSAFLVLCLPVLVYVGTAADGPAWQAAFNCMIVFLGGAIAFAVIAIRMRGRWKIRRLPDYALD